MGVAGEAPGAGRWGRHS